MRDPVSPPLRYIQHAATNERLDRLERTVDSLVNRFDSTITQGRKPLEDPESSRQSVQVDTYGPPTVYSGAPVLAIRDVATEVGVDAREGLSNYPKTREIHRDLITDGILSNENARSLLQLFHEHYGRWVSFDTNIAPETLLAQVRKSPLLLCSCCLIAVRHTSMELASNLAPRLFNEAKLLLSTALLTAPQSVEFFQASLVLSLWSTSIGQVPLSIDSWLLSGFALQHCLASNVFEPISNRPDQIVRDKSQLDRWCIWNHLCLAHLQYCIGTRRKAMLARKQIDRCRGVLHSDHATNFESRMVAEVNLYWIIYENTSISPVDLPGTQAALRRWKVEWEYLINQPRSQFLQMGFHFAQLLAYDQSLKTRSAAVRESLLSEMVQLSVAILNLAMDTTDERTRHLTDHIYHMITFSAITLCRLLHLYEDQLTTQYTVAELDTLIIRLVSWLHSIGLACHVAHTLGDVVAAFHKKLRPEALSSEPTEYDNDISLQTDFALLFPELLGLGQIDGSTGEGFPEWQPTA